MKRLGLILIFATLLTSCTFWTNDSGENSLFDNTLNEKVAYSEDLDGIDRIELTVDLTVSKVEIIPSGGTTLLYDQSANRDELLAELDKDKKGDVLALTFANSKKPKLTAGTQNSEAVIRVPENVEVVLVVNLDVGDLSVDMDGIAFMEIDASSNVGKIHLNATDDQEKLSYVKATTDVGDVKITLDGDSEALETVFAESNTGEVVMTFDGKISSALDVEAKTNVGSVNASFTGTYEDPVKISTKADVGDIELILPKNHPITLDASTVEFTSKLNLDDMAFKKSKSLYTVEGEGSEFTIDLSVNVGDATLKYGN